MLDEIPAWVGEQATPWAVLILVVLFIITGRLIPLFYYKELKEDRDRLKESNQNLIAAVSVFAQVMPEILEVGKTTEKIMTSAKEKLEESA